MDRKNYIMKPKKIVPLLGQEGELIKEEKLAPAGTPIVSYHGGKLLTSVEVVTIFWGAAWTMAPQAGLIAQLNNFFDFILTSSLIDILREYSANNQYIGYGSRTGSFTITSSEPGGATKQIDDSDIQSTIKNWIKNGDISAPGPNTLYSIYLPPGVVSTHDGLTSCVKICGYHSDIDGNIFYAVMPFVTCIGCTSGSSQFDTFTKVSSHELCEAITNPSEGGWWDDETGNEIGDICNSSVTQLGGFTIQTEWSNYANSCTLRRNIIPQQISTGRNQDGRLEVFYTGLDNSIYHFWQLAPNGGWGKDIYLNQGDYAKQITVASNQDDRLEVFYVGNNDKLYHNWQTAANGNWNGEEWIGDNDYAKQITAILNNNGALMIFYIGTNDSLYYNWQLAIDNWKGETLLGGSAKQVIAGKNQDNRIELFYIGTNDAIYHNWQLAVGEFENWSGETALGGFAKQLAIGNNEDGRLELFYIGTDDRLYHNWQVAPNGGWSGEVALGGAAKIIAISNNHDKRLELFYTGMNDQLYHNWQTMPNGGWSGEAAFGIVSKQIAVADNEDGRIELLYIDSDNALYHIWQIAPNGTWSNAVKF